MLVSGSKAHYTRLHGGHKSSEERLLAHGADVHKKDIEGATPLQLAAVGGRKIIVETLLERGARMDEKDGIETVLDKVRRKRSILQVLHHWRPQEATKGDNDPGVVAVLA